MALRKLYYAPEQARYGLKPGAATRRVQTAGGLSRHRLDQIGAPALVELAWLGDEAAHDYLLAFYRMAVADNAGRFLIDLIYDELSMTEMEVRFADGMQLTAQSGDAYALAAKVELAPVSRDAEADEDLIASYAAYVDGLAVMALTPSRDGYSVSRVDELLTARLSLGPSGIRAGLANNARLVNVNWNVDAERYRYLSAFYFTGTKEASLPFLAPLIIDDGDVSNHKALMIPGSFTLSGLNGNRQVVSADLEVSPIPRSEGADLTIVSAWEGTIVDPPGDEL